MTSKTYFCYGIPVTNESLTYATMAYPKLDGPFRFIRLAQKRIREGSLKTAHASVVESVPIEIWDLVRRKVIDVELCAAEREFLKRVRRDSSFSCHCPRSARQWASLLRCNGCVNKLLAYEGFRDAAFAEKCRVLLHDYGLDMPSTAMLKPSPLDFCALTNGDPSAVAFVALSPAPKTDKIDADDHVSCHQPKVDQDDGVWPVSLDKPADADQRFRRLLRDLNLTPLKVSDGTIGIARATDPTHGRTYEEVSTDQVRPKWHLFTTVEYVW